jgi:hypothetical protein
VSHRSVVIRDERVRLYRSRRDYWFANQGDRTFVFYPDDAGWHLVHEPRNQLGGGTSAGTGRTMQKAVDNSALPDDVSVKKGAA